MPSVISHDLLAKQVYDNIDSQNIDKSRFLLGALGPDFFYASKVRNKKDITRLGSLYHHSNADKALKTFVEVAQSIDNDAYSFAMGFLTHYALDSTAHPFVLAAVDEMLPDCRRATEKTLHDKIEINLDVIILREKTGKIPSEVQLKEMIPAKGETLNSIAELWSKASEKLFDFDVSEDEIIGAYADFRKFLNRYQDNTGIKRPFYRRMEALRNMPPVHSSRIRSILEDDDYDYSNISKNMWTHNGIQSNATFFELFESAAQLSEKLIACAMNNEPMTALIDGKGFI